MIISNRLRQFVALAAMIFAADQACALGTPGPRAVPDGVGPHGLFFNMPAGKYQVAYKAEYSPATATLPALTPSERVIGVVVEGTPYCFPIRLMTYHHIAEVHVSNTAYVVTYCALADSAVMFSTKAISAGHYGILGSYGGTLIVHNYLDGGLLVAPQIRPTAELPPIDFFYRRYPRISDPCTITNYENWVAVHPTTLLLQPKQEYQAHYAEYDRSPRGYQPSEARDKGLLKFDARLDPGHEMFGIAINNDAACWTMEEIERRGFQIVKLGGRQVDVRWDAALGAPVVASNPLPSNLIATRCYWYAWANFYPEGRVFGLEDARLGAGERASVPEWDVFD